MTSLQHNIVTWKNRTDYLTQKGKIIDKHRQQRQIFKKNSPSQFPSLEEAEDNQD